MIVNYLIEISCNFDCKLLNNYRKLTMNACFDSTIYFSITLIESISENEFRNDLNYY